LYFVIPFLTLVALAEATVLPHLRVGNTQPDLMLLVVGAWSVRRGVEEGAVWAFIGGMALELLSAGPFSAVTFALLAVSLLWGVDPATGTGRRQGQGLGGNPLSLIVGTVLASLAFHVVLLAALQLTRDTGRPPDWLDAARRVIVPHTIFNLVLIPLVYQLLGWLDRRSGRRELIL
jgi:rod shape-determining protein MreD